ncbi:MAG: HEAT repeat domain-containing protein [Myxococcota bacterium]
MADELRARIDARLDRYPGDIMPFAPYMPVPAPLHSFEEHKAIAIREMNERLAAAKASIRTPPDPSLISIKSWQFGFTGSESDDAATRSARDGLYLRLQSHRGDYVSSEQWRGFFEAIDNPKRWVEFGEAAEAEGWTVEANACFAAARWLDPGVEERIATAIAGRSNDALPARLVRQPDAGLATQPFMQRHWLAWDMKNYGRLDLPTLMRWACDPNFSVRARIYRSLGQRPHPASIQTLHEGRFDPHPFARAQALRSLGWCADPTALEFLRTMAASDPDAEVRRTAAKAAQRIEGYWWFYGEWNAIAGSAERMLEVARFLVDKGLPAFVYNIVVLCDRGDDGALGELVDSIEADALERDREDEELYARSQYHHWFSEAQEHEARRDSLTDEEARSDARQPGAAGFEGRRTLRHRGLAVPS